MSKNKGENTGLKELIEIKGLLEKSQKEKIVLKREIGRIEGEMSYNEKNLARIKSFEDKSDFVKIPVSNLEDFSNIVDKYTNEIDKTNEILVLKNILGKIKEAINNLILVYRKKGWILWIQKKV